MPIINLATYLHKTQLHAFKIHENQPFQNPPDYLFNTIIRVVR